MGSRGPRPKPTAIKVAQGNPGKRRLNDQEPIPPAGAITPPDWIRESGRKVWEELAPKAEAMGVLTTADTLTFARYCDTFGEWLDLQAWIKTQARGNSTYTVLDSRGGIAAVKELPQAKRAVKLNVILTRLEGEYGLTAASRSRIRIERAAAQAPAASAADEARRAFFAAHTSTTAAPKSEVG